MMTREEFEKIKVGNKIWNIEYQSSKEGMKRVEDKPKGLYLPNFTAADLLGANVPKDNLLINGSVKDHKTKTMKKKKAKKYKFHKGEFSDRVKQLVWDNRARMPISELVALYPEVLPKMTKWDKVNILLSMYDEGSRTLDNMIEYIEVYCWEKLTVKQIKKYLSQF